MHAIRTGVPSAKFQRAADATWDGSRTALLELAGSGGQTVLSSRGQSIFASYGYAVLDRDAPADLRSVLTVRASDVPASIAAIAPAQFAREVRCRAPELSVIRSMCSILICGGMNMEWADNMRTVSI